MVRRQKMNLWFCKKCNKTEIIDSIGACPNCGGELEMVTGLGGEICETVFVDEYKYMVFFDIYDIRWDKHRFHRREVTLDHEFCEKDYGELENKYTDNTHNTCIIGIVKEPLV
jgi:hypothetical protein